MGWMALSSWVREERTDGPRASEGNPANGRWHSDVRPPPRSAAQAAQIVRQGLRRQVVGEEAHALAPAAVQQDRGGRVVGAPELRPDAELAPDRGELGPCADG